MHKLLSDMRDAERRCLEVVACQKTRKMRAEARLSRRRIRAYERLLQYVSPTAVFPEDCGLEGILRATVDVIEKNKGWVRDHHFDHVFI